MNISHKTIRFALALTIVSSSFALSTQPANAASCDATEAASVLQLRAELGKLAGKNQHAGVLRTFKKMLDLEKQKCELKADDYRLAGNAARNIGDIGNAIAWFDVAGDTTNSGDLKARFGQVVIKTKAGDLSKDGGLPFVPDERAALDAGVAAVKSSGKFEGYLPLGKYSVAGKSLEVKAGVVTKL